MSAEETKTPTPPPAEETSPIAESMPAPMPAEETAPESSNAANSAPAMSEETPAAREEEATEFQSMAPNDNESEFVDYTKVAADYREYGERTPRDQNITQAVQT